MIVLEGKLKGKEYQYRKLDEAIRTGLFIRNAWSEFRCWLEYFGKVFGVATVAVKPHYTSRQYYH